MAYPTHTGQSSTDLEKELALDIAQLTLDLIGIVEPTPFADTASGVISVYRGDWLGAGLSLVSFIPYLGDLAKIGKLPKLVGTVVKAVTVAAKDSRFAKSVAPKLIKLRALLAKLSPESLPAAVRSEVERLGAALDDFTAKHAPVTVRAPAIVNAGSYSFRLLDDLEVDSFLKVLGMQNAPASVREKVALAGGFLMHHGEGAGKVVDYLKAIDLYKEVKLVPLKPRSIVTQHLSGRLGKWFSKSGVSTYDLGISKGTRQLRRFEVVTESYVLESRASGTVDTWTWGRTQHRWVPTGSGTTRQIRAGEYVTGGGIQYFFPKAENAIREVLR